MDADTRIERQGGMLESEIDGEIVGLQLATDTCYGFNATASAIWRLLEQPRTMAELCRGVTDEFDVDADTCAREVAALVEELAGDGLLKLTPPVASA